MKTGIFESIIWVTQTSTNAQLGKVGSLTSRSTAFIDMLDHVLSEYRTAYEKMHYIFMRITLLVI